MKRILNNINLSDRTSFGVCQQAATLVEFESAEHLREYFDEFAPSKWYILGGGNNTLFTRDYDGVIFTPVARGLHIISEEESSVCVRVEAGTDWDEFVAWSVKQGLWGLENLSAIPSSVGAAPVQNIGAYGAEAKDTISVVEYFDVPTREIVRLKNAECEFGYRESRFKHDLKGRAIILAVEFKLSREPHPNLGYGDVVKEVEARGGATQSNIREAICAIRGRKLPDPKVLGNAGSFFKNPIVEREVANRLLLDYPNMPFYEIAGDKQHLKLAAGWLIDTAGMKGYREGCVGVHDRQALVLVNLGGATGNDVLALARKVCDTVREKFGVEISPEVNIL